MLTNIQLEDFKYQPTENGRAGKRLQAVKESGWRFFAGANLK